MATYNEQLQKIWKKYEDAGNTIPATARDVARWAISQNCGNPNLMKLSLNARKNWLGQQGKNTEQINMVDVIEFDMRFGLNKMVPNYVYGQILIQHPGAIWRERSPSVESR